MMYDDDQELERRLASAMPRAAPASLRAATLAKVERELRSMRFDRRLGRLAAAVFFVGIALNASLAMQGDARPAGAVKAPLAANSRIALAETAVVVAEATDAETARHFVRQMAALDGWDFSYE
jgi:hypothetical protein